MPCAGTVAGLMAGLVLAASEPVVIATDAPFPAYTYLDDAGRITGFERDLMDEICRRAVLDCRWTDVTFDQLIPGVMAGDYDVVLGGMAVTPERRDMVDFTQTYRATDPDEWYIGRPGAPEPAAALTAVQSGTMQEAHLRAMGYRHLVFTTEPEVLAALVAGKVDLALGPFETRTDIRDYIARNGFDYLYSEPIPDEGVAMAVCKGNGSLLAALNTAIGAIRDDGTLASFETRWFE
ncbi:transporter substrate-binding domain-containing protein [Tabrizicola sp.]|uniref:transporter substrate-binding domain-containing protein n=1 Tax=Tabrizicola sp. TaxID=2005166 RepID=UPI002FDE31F1